MIFREQSNSPPPPRIVRLLCEPLEPAFPLPPPPLPPPPNRQLSNFPNRILPEKKRKKKLFSRSPALFFLFIARPVRRT